MTLERVGLLAVDSSRTRAYLARLEPDDLVPGYMVFLAGAPGTTPPTLPSVPYFDNTTPAVETIRRLGVPCRTLETLDVNAAEVVEAVRDAPVEVFVYSGPGGAILRADLLAAGKRFLHVHPGMLPRYRGSTTVYYSLLEEGSCGASALFLDERIDTGPLLAVRAYPAPEDRSTIDHGYDPHIRADLLARVLAGYRSSGAFSTASQPAGGETYFVMHPVLRHVAVLSRRSPSPAGRFDSTLDASRR